MSALRNAARRWYVHKFQVKRTEGFYVRGVYQKVRSELIWGCGNFQPASKKETERLPEGARVDGALTLYTDAQLRSVDSPNTVADRVLYNGIEYEVSTGEYWPSHNLFVVTKVAQ